MGIESVYNPDGYCTYRDKDTKDMCFMSTPCHAHPVSERMKTPEKTETN